MTDVKVMQPPIPVQRSDPLCPIWTDSGQIGPLVDSLIGPPHRIRGFFAHARYWAVKERRIQKSQVTSMVTLDAATCLQRPAAGLP